MSDVAGLIERLRAIAPISKQAGEAADLIEQLTSGHAAKMALHETEDENRLRCSCGDERWLVNLEGVMADGAPYVVNSAECVACHKIYSVSVEASTVEAATALQTLTDKVEALTTQYDAAVEALRYIAKQWPDSSAARHARSAILTNQGEKA